MDVAFLTVASLLTIITPVVIAGRVRDTLAALERRLVVRSWHLQQLLPDPAREAVGGPPGVAEPRAEG